MHLIPQKTTLNDASAERWFKDGVDVNTVDIGEAHW